MSTKRTEEAPAAIDLMIASLARRPGALSAWIERLVRIEAAAVELYRAHQAMSDDEDRPVWDAISKLEEAVDWGTPSA